jgi:hypothetical protein
MAIPARCLSGQASTRRELLKRCQLTAAVLGTPAAMTSSRRSSTSLIVSTVRRRQKADRRIPRHRRTRTVRPAGAGRRRGRTGLPYLHRRGDVRRAPTRRGRSCPRQWVLETAYAQIGGGEQILSAVQPSLPRPVAFREGLGGCSDLGCRCVAPRCEEIAVRHSRAAC